MNATRLWTIGSVLVILVLIVGTWFVGVAPRLDEATAANQTRETVEAQNAAHTATLATLEKQFEGIDELRDELEAIRVAIPGDGGLPDLISQLNRLASTAGVTISSLNFGDAQPYMAAEIPPEDAELAAALAAVPGDGFYVIPVEISIAGRYDAAIAFVDALQRGARIILVHDLALTSGVMAAGTAVEMNLSGQTFVLLDGASGAQSQGGVSAPTEGQPAAQ